MKRTILPLLALAATATGVYASPGITLNPSAVSVQVGDVFTVDVVAHYDAMTELGSMAELTSFGFMVDPSSMFTIGDYTGFTMNMDYDDFSMDPGEVVGIAGLDGGSTDTMVTLGTLSFTATGLGTQSLEIFGDESDSSGTMGLYYTVYNDIGDPLDDQYLSFDLSGSTSISVVPEPATTAFMAGAAALAALGFVRRRRA